MKTIIFRIFTLLALPLLAHSCYKDKSTEAEGTIPRISIDADAAPAYAYVRQGDLIEIDPAARMEDGSEADLSYEWYVIYMEWGEPQQLAVVGDPVSTEEVFRHVVLERPNAWGDCYVIVLLLTDNKTGITETLWWQYEVTSGLGEGLVVAYRSEGGTDLGLIVDPLFSEYQDDENRTITGIYSDVAGAPLDAVVDQMVFTRGMGLFAISDDDIFNIDKADYSLKGRGGDIFLPEAPLNPDMLMLCGGSLFLINDGDIYNGVNTDDEWAARYFTVTGTGDYTISGPVAYSYSGNLSTGMPIATFYDGQRGMFQLYGMLGSYTLPHAMGYGENGFMPAPGAPDPDNIPGFTSVAAGMGYFRRHYHLLKENATGDYYVYTLGTAGEGITSVNQAATESIGTASGYKFHPENHVMYYWTEHKVYSVYLGQTPLTATAIYTAPDGERITHFAVYNQACYALSEENSIETNNRLLLVGTYDGSEGTLHAIPTYGTAGAVMIEEATSFGGFGEILTTIAQE